MRRLRGERGQASVELLGTLGWLLLVALLIWQVALAGWAHVQASNAARTASRADARGGEATKAARNALPAALRRGMTVRVQGERATVAVRIPILFPGLGTDGVRATQSATLPS